MSKASEWADQYRKRNEGRPVFETRRATRLKIAQAADNGTLEMINFKDRMLPQDAVAFGNWLIETFSEYP